MSNMFTVLESLDAEVDVSSTWETIRDGINIQAKRVQVVMD
jgi:hypothetical protein